MNQKMMEYSAPPLPIHQQNISAGISPNPVSNIAFENVYGQGRINQLGGAYINGRPLPPKKRLQIVEMAKKGVKPCVISRELKVWGCVQNFDAIGGNPRSRISIQAVRLHILRLCAEHSGIGASQIQQLLVQRGICSRQNVPSSSRINRLLKAQKNRRNGEGRSEKEAENGKKTNATGKPLSHSIENILGPNESSNDDGKRASMLALASESKMNDIVPSISFTSSSSSSEAHSSTIFNLASASDEENHQQQQKKQQTMQLDSRRARTSFSQEQLRLLEKTFRENKYPGQEQKEWLVKATQLDEDKIITWFSNRRARSRRKAFQHCPSFQKLFSPSFPNDQNGQSHKNTHQSPPQIDLNAQMVVAQQCQQPNNPTLFPFLPILSQFSTISPFLPMFFNPPFGNFNGFPNFQMNLQNMKASEVTDQKN